MKPQRVLCLLGWVVSLLTLSFSFKKDITLLDSSLRLDLPDRIYFALEVSSGEPIEKITLLYQSNARSCQEGVARQEVEFEPGSHVQAEWMWELKFSGTIPPGAQLSWQWEIEDRAGNKRLTDLQTETVEDQAFDWQKISQGEVSVWWVDGGQSFGRQMLNLSLDSLDRLEKEVGVRPTRPVVLVLYPNNQAMRDAVLFEPDWTGGQAYWDYGVVLIGLTPRDTEWAKEVVPHELAHVVTRELMFNCYGVQPPTWLVEGLAVYLEGPASPEDIESLRAALDKGTLTPLHGLASGFSSNPVRVSLDYAQSGEVIRFLIKTYGPEKMAALLSTFQAGKMFESALQEVYGLSTDGVDAAWRQSWGYEAIIPTLEPTQASSRPARTAVPTLALWTAVVQASATPLPSETPLPPTHTATPLPSSTALPNTPLPTNEPPTPLPTSTPAPAPSGLPCGSIALAPVGLAIFWAVRRKGISG